MDLFFDKELAKEYHSASQISRVLTESWVANNMFCPQCGNLNIKHFENNKPVADFFCPICNNQYELKSKSGNIQHKITDGAYETMIQRITSNDNPDFFFMNYSKQELKVKDLVFVPKYFFVPDVIEKRKPLSGSARRAGWIGCNIIIDKIPKQGLVPIITNGREEDINKVLINVNKSARLKTNDISMRGWIMDILNCVNNVNSTTFTLKEIYAFEDELHKKHNDNNHIKDKIRQQLQLLRDNGFIEFLGNGNYRKI
jgi:type II restriction enzyme